MNILIIITTASCFCVLLKLDQMSLLLHSSVIWNFPPTISEAIPSPLSSKRIIETGMQLKYSTSEQGNALNLFWENCWSFFLFGLFSKIPPFPFWKHHSLTWYISHWSWQKSISRLYLSCYTPLSIGTFVSWYPAHLENQVWRKW